jgi:hypothetical protein
VSEQVGWWISVWRGRFGWYGQCVDYGDGDVIPIGPPTFWRPSRSWVERVCRRYVRRHEDAETRRAAALTAASASLRKA